MGLTIESAINDLARYSENKSSGTKLNRGGYANRGRGDRNGSLLALSLLYFGLLSEKPFMMLLQPN